MEWSQKRKILYALLFAGIFILLASYPVYSIISKPATCFDGKQNGSETGLDCGGGCALVCTPDAKPLRIVWAKAFAINDNTYDLGAYVENPNTNVGLRIARYTMRVFDDVGGVLAEKTGVTEFAPSSTNLIFETGATFSGTADHVLLSFDSADLTKWTRATTLPSTVVTKNQSLTSIDIKPRFDAVLVNTDPVNDVAGLTLGAIVYDTLRNPIAVSRTYVDALPKNGQENIFFTWPHKFSSTSQSFITEIIVTPRATFAQ